ncbi:MAG: ATPase, T2SS/T4P/T4SS family [Candidatus Hydrogenedentota bacterium]
MAVHQYSMFGQQLVDRGIITKDQLDEAIHRQQTTMSGKKIGEVLVRLGHISKSHISEALAQQLGIPIIKISEREIPERIRNLIDSRIATLYRVVPLEERGEVLVIATADPTNINSLDNLQRLLDRPIEPVLSAPDEISQALGKYYGLADQTVETMLSTVSSASTMSTLSSMSNLSSLGSSSMGTGTGSSFGSSFGSSLGSSFASSDGSMSSMSMDSIDMDEAQLDSTGAPKDDDDADSPVVRYVQHLIMEAFRLRASDIHVEPGKFDVKVRYRVDGVLHLMPKPPKRAQAAIISRLKIMSGMDIAEKRVPQDGRIKMQIGNRSIDLRVSSLPAYYGPSMVMRILDKEGLKLGLGQLGFSPDNQRNWENLLGSATGVILVTGPTGSGKTTTLYASLHNLNKPDTKLITVEDPVEYQLTGINQVQINHEIGWNFSRALRAIFRQDPDIVMVGEIRDLETAEIAIKAALTGHMVFSTLHTNDAPSSFVRMIDIGIKPFLVASGVRAILAQRLVRTSCTACKVQYTPADIEFHRLGFAVDRDKLELLHGAGCDACNGTGYSGRMGIHELLLSNDVVRQMLMRGASTVELRRQARLDGMITLREDAWRKTLNGITTIEEVNKRTKPDEPLRQDSEKGAA